MTISDLESSSKTGMYLLLSIPFIGLVLNYTDPPVWVQIPGVVLIVALVGVGCGLMRKSPQGWMPSKTTTDHADDGH